MNHYTRIEWQRVAAEFARLARSARARRRTRQAELYQRFAADASWLARRALAIID